MIALAELADPRVTDPEAVKRPEQLRRPLRLDIGGGADPYAPDEYATVDIGHEPDVVADMGDLPFADGVVRAIWASHVLEHCPMHQIAGVLQEWLRVLEPGGRIIVRVPNFDYVAKYWLTGPDRTWAEAMIYGHQADDGEFHKAAFTASTIRDDLSAAGFEVLRVEMRWTHNQETLQAVARRPLQRAE